MLYAKNENNNKINKIYIKINIKNILAEFNEPSRNSLLSDSKIKMRHENGNPKFIKPNQSSSFNSI